LALLLKFCITAWQSHAGAPTLQLCIIMQQVSPKPLAAGCVEASWPATAAHTSAAPMQEFDCNKHGHAGCSMHMTLHSYACTRTKDCLHSEVHGGA